MAGENTRHKPWHSLSPEELFPLLATSMDRGLDPAEVERRRQRFGANRLTPKKGRSPLVLFLLQFHQPLVYILLAAALVAGLLKAAVDAGVILGVVIVNAVIGYLQEAKAVRAMEALARGMGTEADVLRAGERRRIPAAELVPGDIVLLQPGDRVPADLRLVVCRNLGLDESALTGESLPVEKEADAVPGDTPLADRVCMAYSSSLVTAGTGTGIVVEVGDRTEVGRIGEMIAGAQTLATPLTRKVARFSRSLLWVILGFALLTFLAGLARGEAWLDMLMAAVALAVGAIPEGLPAAMTITLAIGVGRMARRNAIVRRLPAVETLGSTTVICTDKTGTLTLNRMTVRAILAGGERFTLSGEGYLPEGRFGRAGSPADPFNCPALVECLQAGLLCNDARLVRDAAGGWQVEGDPTEGALIVSAAKAGLTAGEAEQAFTRLDELPFDSRYQYMATLFDAGGRRVVYLKGALESMLPRCANALGAGGDMVSLSADSITHCAGEMGMQGLRVLAFARLHLPSDATSLDPGDLASGLTFLGLQGMIDPPRPEAVEAVRNCQGAGIRVVMITGDHLQTAQAIATAVGIAGTAGEGAALSGRQLEGLSDAHLRDRVATTAVFARVAPEQKLRLVRALQARGEVVAMTGDGVNDAPALSQADIGVAMGMSGTEVAREAADMVLTDDNFATIEAAVEEGRGVYDNLLKFIAWTLPTNIGEGLVILVAVFWGRVLPILPVQILWVNMTTAVLMGLMLAFEPKEPGIMARQPRMPASPILSREIVFRMSLVGLLLLLGAFGLFEEELRHGESLEAARTAAVNVFVVGELFYLFTCRSLVSSMFRLGLFTNRWLLAGVATMTALQLLFTYHPVMNFLFRTEPIGLPEWRIIMLVGVAVYVVVELEKLFWRRRGGVATG